MTKVQQQRRKINKLTKECGHNYQLLFNRYNISEMTFYIMYCLYEEGARSISQSDLCERLLCSKQTVNSAIAVIKKNGWIELNTVPNAKNRKNIILTNEGKIFCDEIISETIDLEEKTYAHFSEEEMSTFIDIFKRLNNYFSEEITKSENI